MGLRREALRAGARPKTIPTETETPKAKATDQKETVAGKSIQSQINRLADFNPGNIHLTNLNGKIKSGVL